MLKKGCGCNKSANVTPELPKDWGIPKINLNPIEDPCKKPWDCPDIQPAVQIVNNPDNEDITSVQVGTSDVLKFADKVYDPLVFSGMGRVFLRKNLVDDNSSLSCASKVNKLEQSMFEDKNGQPLTNTIFIVQYDYDLQGAFITIPCNSILLFLGGSFSNGTVILTNTLVLPHMLEYSKYMNCAIKGSFAKGQTFYSDGVIKVWNGSSWVEFAGSEDSGYSQLIRDLDQRLTLYKGLLDQAQISIAANTNNLSDLKGDVSNVKTQVSNLSQNKINKGSLATVNSHSLENGGNINIESSGGGTYTLTVATKNALGGIKIGATKTSTNYPVQLDSQNRAYVKITGGGSSGGGSTEEYDDTWIHDSIDNINDTIDNLNDRVSTETMNSVNDMLGEFAELKRTIPKLKWGEVVFKSGFDQLAGRWLQQTACIYDANTASWSTLEQTINNIKASVNSLEIISGEGEPVTIETIRTMIQQAVNVDAFEAMLSAYVQKSTFEGARDNLDNRLRPIESWNAGFFAGITGDKTLAQMFSEYTNTNQLNALVQTKVDKSTFASEVAAIADSRMFETDAQGHIVYDDQGNPKVKVEYLSSVVLKSDLDSAVATLIAASSTNSTKAAIEAKVQEGVSSITLSANSILLNSIITNINSKTVTLGEGAFEFTSTGDLNIFGSCTHIWKQTNTISENEEETFAQIVLGLNTGSTCRTGMILDYQGVHFDTFNHNYYNGQLLNLYRVSQGSSDITGTDTGDVFETKVYGERLQMVYRGNNAYKPVLLGPGLNYTGVQEINSKQWVFNNGILMGIFDDLALIPIDIMPSGSANSGGGNNQQQEIQNP